MYTKKPIKKARQEGRARIYGGATGLESATFPLEKRDILTKVNYMLF